MEHPVQTIAPDLWATLRGVFELDPHAFVASLALKDSILVALAIVVLAGLSEAIGQSVVLFANRVPAGRFAFSLLISAVLFAFSYAFLTLSTWAITYLPLATRIPLRSLAIVYAVSYAPLVFSFLEAMPYAGLAIGWVLRIWYLLASLVGIAAVGNLPLPYAVLYVGVGWLVFVAARQTLGKPIMLFGLRLMSLVSGVSFQPEESKALEIAQEAEEKPTQLPSAGAVRAHKQLHPLTGRWQVLAGLLGFVIVGVVMAVAVRPLQSAMFGWTVHLPTPLRLPFDLLWFGIVAALVAAILAPLETLGWWAGWYGDDVAPPPPPSPASATGISRYMIYLDGIGQSSSQYTPDVETFLDALAPTLPARICLLRGLMVYSVLNKPLDQDPIWSNFWRLIEKTRLADPASVLGMFINLRNVIIVAVSADSRYGPIYNYGIAKLLYKGLIDNGYQVGSGVPVTLIGYSGGGQMAAAAASFLKRAIKAPVEEISLGGVMSGTSNFLDLESLHHLVGDKDDVTRLGPILFASRWKIVWNSYWNRASKRGIIEWVSLGPVGHQVPGGMFDPVERLANGRTNLQNTLLKIADIVRAKT